MKTKHLNKFYSFITKLVFLFSVSGFSFISIHRLTGTAIILAKESRVVLTALNEFKAVISYSYVFDFQYSVWRSPMKRKGSSVIIFLVILAIFLPWRSVMGKEQGSPTINNLGATQEIVITNHGEPEIIPQAIVEYMIPEGDLLPAEAKDAIAKALTNWQYEPPENGRFSILSLRWESNWLLATFTSADLLSDPIPGQETSVLNGRLASLVLVFYRNEWKAAIEGDQNIGDLLDLIPETELNSGAKNALFFENNNSLEGANSIEQEYINYKFPWPSDRPWDNDGDWHGPSNLAIDFDVVDNTNSDVLSAAPGIITRLVQCSPSDHYIIRITTENTSESITLIHLNGASVRAEGLQQGDYVYQGRKLGQMAGAFNGSDTCNIVSSGTHLHVEFPEKPFLIDGISFSQDNIHSGEELYSSQGGNGSPIGYEYCISEGGRCEFSGSADIAYGANGLYEYQNLSDGTDCNNNVFSDPIPGTHKACYIRGGGPPGYTFCANEGGHCSFSGNADVAYGASLKYNYQYGISGGIDCNNGVFGDPIFGTPKACYFKSVGGATGNWQADYYDTTDRWWDHNNSNNYKCSETISGPELGKNYDDRAPCGGMDGDTWVGEYRATIDFPAGDYVFNIDHDDGLKLWLNDNNIADKSSSETSWICPPRPLSGNQNLRAILREDGGSARINVSWSSDTSICDPPTAFSKSNPANGSADISINPSLSWTSSSQVDRYEYCIDTTDNNSCDGNWIDVGNTNSENFSGLEYNTNYYWQVRAVNSNGSTEANSGTWWNFITENGCHEPGTPYPLSPFVGTPINNNLPTLLWSTVPNTTSYHVQIALDQDFSNLIEQGNTTETQYIPGEPLDDNIYYWRIRGINESNGCNVIGNWNLSVFKVDTIAPDVQIISPQNDTFINENMILIEADASDTGYGFIVDFYVEHDNFWDYIGEGINVSNGWALTWDANDISDQKLRFQAEAIDSASNSSGSNLINIILDRTSPLSAVEVLPLLSPSMFTVSWGGTDNLAGISSFDIQYQENDGAWIDWQQNVTGTSATFNGLNGYTYSFRSRAEDLATNLEDWPLVPDTQTIIDTEPPTVSWVSPVTDGNVYQVISGMVLLGADASDNVQVTRINFYRWDAVNELWINIGDVFTPPYQLELDSDVLNYSWNQINVRAYDTGGNISDAPYIWINRLNPEFSKNMPMDGASDIYISMSLRWNSSDGASDYEYCIDTLDNSSCDDSWVNVGNTTMVVLNGLNYSTTYYWQVRAVNVHGSTEADDGYWWNFITMDIPPGITVDPTSGLVTTEAGGTDTFTVVLDSQPTADVTINLRITDGTEGDLSLSSLIFNSSTWNLPQTVTITGVDDPINDGDMVYYIITDSAISNDPNYDGLNPTNIIVINEDDGDQPPMTGSIGLINTGDASEVEKILTAWGYAVTLLPVDAGISDFHQYEIVYLPSSWASSMFGDYTAIESNSLDYQTYITEGGGLMVDQPNPFQQPNESVTPSLLPYPVTFDNWYNTNDWPPVIAISSHFLTEGLSGSEMPGPADQMANVDPSYEILVRGQITNSPSLVISTYGKGRILIQTSDAKKIGDEAYRRMVEWVKGVVPNDDFDDAEIINNLPYTNIQDTTGATSVPDDPALYCLGVPKYNSVWYSYTPVLDGRLTIDTFGSDYDTVLALWSGARGSLNNIACDDDTDGFQSQVAAFVTTGKTYLIEIASYSEYSNGQLNLSASVATLPATPTDLIATVTSSTHIDLSWTDNASDETGYEINRSLDGSNWEMIATIVADTTIYSDTGLSSDVTYFYQVCAYNDAGSTCSEVASATTFGLPLPPLNLITTAISDDQVDLTWTDQANNETGFEIERSLDGSTNWTLIDSLGPNFTSYSDTGLSSGTTYYYRVRAFNMAGYSPYSNMADATTSSTPAAPSDLVATAVSDTEIDLGWVDNASNETGYELERSLDGIANWTLVASLSPNVTSYTDTGLNPGMNYYYQVCAFNDVGNACSDIASADTLEPPASEDYFANSELNVAGSISGNFLDTHNNDGVSESITERESGGKPNQRYSYLEHKWIFDVLPGNLITFQANIWTPPSSDNDTFILAYSTDDVTYTDMFTVTSTSDDASYQTYMLPSSLSGPVYIRVKDTDQTSGNKSLDILFVDHMFIRIETVAGDPPEAPTGLLATAISSSQIDLVWIDNASNESGFEIERSLDGINWALAGTVGVDIIGFTEIGLVANTTYYYRVRAYNALGQSQYSNHSSAITSQAGTIHVGDLDGSVNFNRNKWNAIVLVSVHDANENPVSGVIVDGIWSNGSKGTGTCVTDNFGQCTMIKSNMKTSISSVTFSVTNLNQPGFVYQPGDNHDPEGDSDGTAVTIFQ